MPYPGLGKTLAVPCTAPWIGAELLDLKPSVNRRPRLNFACTPAHNIYLLFCEIFKSTALHITTTSTAIATNYNNINNTNSHDTTQPSVALDLQAIAQGRVVELHRLALRTARCDISDLIKHQGFKDFTCYWEELPDDFPPI
ncbi:hypothetical protein FALBO_16411 [Fusarium albosuccineum]|uniref:Uncharacterized protein n=1 Tax=Fusarium albosuccineum TaxID=1237068 RepID=A0A8H4KJS8_9HYPO|nr:hypothetical protein FALBO_16411 [Fusarium albosuccineum]